MTTQSQTATCPTTRFFPIPRITVLAENDPGSGQFIIDSHLCLEYLTSVSNGDIPEATFSIRLESDFLEAEAKEYYHPEKRIVVIVGVAILFDGYPDSVESRWDGNGTTSNHHCTLTASGIIAQLDRLEECWILGRQMQNASSERIHVDALPCVFNADGLANRSESSVSINGQPMHLFTWDGDPSAQFWSHADVLRYLTVMHQSSSELLNCTAMLDSLPSSLDEPVDELDCEGVSLLTALARFSKQVDVLFTTDTAFHAGRIVTELTCVSPGAMVPLHLAPPGNLSDGSPRFDASDLTAEEVFDANEVYRAVLEWDSSKIVNSPIVAGGVKRYEVTVLLLPGWEPVEHLDNVALPNRATAKGIAMLPEIVDSLGDELADTLDWYRRFHRNGSEHAAYRAVGRTWVLNEDNCFDPVAFNRNPPFDDYQPFDFAAVIDVLDPGEWTQRPRRFHDCISISELDTRYNVHVEVSYDSGATWEKPRGSILVLKNRAGIHFDLRNPTSMTPEDTEPASQNMWYALIDQTFRVRVTACIDGDHRVLGRVEPPAGSPITGRRGHIEYASTTYGYATRTGTSSVLADVNPDAEIERDDTAAIIERAEAIVERSYNTRTCIMPAIPWMDTRFSIGDRIPGIPRRNIVFSRPPTVIGKIYRLNAKRYETELVLR